MAGFLLNYDIDEDILWVGRHCLCTGSACIHASGEIREVERDVLLTVNDQGTPRPFVSSIAILHASAHPLWRALWGGLECASRTGTIVMMTFPCRWFER